MSPALVVNCELVWLWAALMAILMIKVCAKYGRLL